METFKKERTRPQQIEGWRGLGSPGEKRKSGEPAGRSSVQ